MARRPDYALDAARRYPNRFAVMGRILLDNPQAAARLPNWREQPGMLGVRLTFLGRAKAWLTDGTPDWFWLQAEKANLPVLILTDGQSAQLAGVAERYPRLQLIADHMGIGGNTPREGRIADAVSQTASLAKYPNVSVKLSGAPNYSSEPYPFRDFTPHIKRRFDAYRPKRRSSKVRPMNAFEIKMARIEIISPNERGEDIRLTFQFESRQTSSALSIFLKSCEFDDTEIVRVARSKLHGVFTQLCIQCEDWQLTDDDRRARRSAPHRDRCRTRAVPVWAQRRDCKKQVGPAEA